jgi:hypothetical protein
MFVVIGIVLKRRRTLRLFSPILCQSPPCFYVISKLKLFILLGEISSLTRRLLSWCAMFLAVQTYLNEPTLRASDSQPGWIVVLTSVVSLVTCYAEFVVPGRGLLPRGLPGKAAVTPSTSS